MERKKRIEGVTMSNNEWILMGGLLPQDRKRRKWDTIDFFLLVAISMMIGLLTMGTIIENHGNEDIPGAIYFGKYSMFLNQELNTIVAIPVYLAVAVLLVLFFISRYRHTKERGNRLLMTLFVLFAVFKIVSTFLYPYGAIDYHYVSPLDQMTYVISYAGFTMAARIKQSISEVLFALYLYEVLTYVPTFGRYTNFWFYVLLFVEIIIPLVLIIYSFIYERPGWIQNINFLKGYGYPSHVHSLTTHKNMFGFFLMLGTFSFLILFFKRHNFLYVIFGLFYAVIAFMILSKASSIFSIAATGLSLIFYPIFFHKKHKANCALSIAMLLLFAAAFVFLVIKFDVKKIIDSIFDSGTTMNLRIQHIQIALSMLYKQSPYYLICGYGRIPFTGIHILYQETLNFEVLWTPHNCFIQVLVHHGIVGCLAILFLYLYTFGRILNLMKGKEGYKEAIIYLILFLMLTIYSNLEPRMIYLLEGTETFLFYFVLIYPCFVDYGRKKNRESYL